MRSLGPPQDVTYCAAHPTAQWRVRLHRKGEFGEDDQRSQRRRQPVAPQVLRSTHVLVVIDRTAQPPTYVAMPLVCPPGIAAGPAQLHAWVY